MPTPDARSSAAAAVETAAAVAQVDWDAVGGQDLLEVAVLLGKVKNQADAALVRITERLGATGSAEAAGWASTKDFLTHALGGRKGAGAAYDRVAKQTADLPVVRAAMSAGDLSLAQAGAIGGRVATLPPGTQAAHRRGGGAGRPGPHQGPRRHRPRPGVPRRGQGARPRRPGAGLGPR
ncbi:DUF222 domain-containing protein [Nocardioides sp. TF02-7]|uniref:DUF222 domain-containing protein n=1 Tax=Nocardioides sp. TF02-7 TaxID=2917724 RepID=UPI001F0696AA|nr:DUF222 domain-containing protein [Nocardioides sp. TF02-7]UMG93555.1 DUF222 domain-containing protein [Nocardioides sp. TF02-7]